MYPIFTQRRTESVDKVESPPSKKTKVPHVSGYSPAGNAQKYYIQYTFILMYVSALF